MNLKKMLKYAHLNEPISLVFFIGRGRTRKLFLSSRRAFLFIGAISTSFILSLVFLVISTAGFQRYMSRGDMLVERSKQILIYQSKYEELFESAYDLKDVQTQANPKINAPKFIEPESWRENLVSPFFFLKSLSIENAVNQFQLKFTLQNASGSPIKGFIWGVAKIKKADGTYYFQGIPKNQIILDDSGQIMDLSLARAYSFKNRWDNELVFKTNEEGETLAKAYIFFADEDGKISSRYNFTPMGPKPLVMTSH